MRLKAAWEAQYALWRQRDLSDVKLSYLWADGVYVKAGLEDSKAALLVLIGAEGRKQVFAVTSGERESASSWAGVLRDLKARGLCAPKLTISPTGTSGSGEPSQRSIPRAGSNGAGITSS